ncbi:MAG TPA: hypothetical protein VIW03_07795 [Anaeromyxobacter sp.]
MPRSTASTADAPYPASAAGAAGEAARDRWIRERRGVRASVDPREPDAAFVEEERTERGDVASVATILLANRECPWRCLMCDLWTHTTEETVAEGAIPAQIRSGLARLPPARRVKLYNAGSFFDPRAIPPADDPAIAAALEPFERVIVESHPALVGGRARALAGRLPGRLEVAMGLETVHPVVLPLLGKRMTPEDFRAAAGRLAGDGIALRAFVLLGLPFVPPEETVSWALESARFAFDCGATAVAIIPTRPGNGALDALARRGEFAPPRLAAVEDAAARGVQLGDGRGRRVFVDLWDLPRLRECAACFPARAGRLETINLEQRVPPPVACEACGSGGGS